jgi:hypothetical protein
MKYEPELSGKTAPLCKPYPNHPTGYRPRTLTQAMKLRNSFTAATIERVEFEGFSSLRSC